MEETVVTVSCLIAVVSSEYGRINALPWKNDSILGKYEEKQLDITCV